MARLLVLLSHPIAWITFPSVMLRQLGRLLICRAMGVTVDYVKYFQFGAPLADGALLRDALRVPGTPGVAKLIGYPLVTLIYAGWVASIILVDFVYAAFIAIGFPMLALGQIP